MFANYAALEAFLNGKGLFHMDFGLGRMRAALAALNLSSYPIIQVLGTNGKGSTCAFLASLARAHDANFGLYMSPHFVTPRERIVLNGRPASEAHWLAAARRLADAAPALLPELTYFEFLTLLAAIIFAEAKVDLGIFEAGLGGKSDATTALGALAHCFTPVARDHAAVLGATLAEIAADKAGAIQPGTRVFSAKQAPGALFCLQNACIKVNAHLEQTEEIQPLPNWRLQGKTQAVNAGLAFAAWRWFSQGWGMGYAQAGDALAKAFLPGRMQIIAECAEHGRLILDSGHNPHALLALRRQLPFAPANVIFSALGDKDWRAGLGALLKCLPKARYTFAQLGNERAADAEAMAAFARGRGARVEMCADLAQALATAHSGALICGSMYLLAEFYRLYPRYLEVESTQAV